MKKRGKPGAEGGVVDEVEEQGSFQVVILGSGGGPNEDNVTGILVRSVAARWTKNSILAVDAGVHLAAITRIIEEHMPGAIRHSAVDHALPSFSVFAPTCPPTSFAQIVLRPNISQPFPPVAKPKDWDPSSPIAQIDPESKLVLTTGPFKNTILPCETPKANALHLLRNLISTYLITHSHLDHVAGFVINTAAFHNTSRPKKLAALPGTIDAIKSHIFNDLIWPNLSDEEGGVGFVSYTRLVEGGNVALGDGEGRGYIEVCEGLEVKCRSVSHGHCMKKHVHRGSGQDFSGFSADRRPSRSSAVGQSPDFRRNSYPHLEYSMRTSSISCAIDSTAFFIRATETGDEILVFGDVEPDSISIAPRNARVWQDAAPKIASGLLKAILIECSYDDSQTDETLYGHLAPRHLIAELATLAEYVRCARGDLKAEEAESLRKRKRRSDTADSEKRRGRTSNRSFAKSNAPSISPATRLNYANEVAQSHLSSVQENHIQRARSSRHANKEGSIRPAPSGSHDSGPLHGLKVIIIHVKDTLQDSGHPSEIILKELLAHEASQSLGVEFVIPKPGGSMYF